MGNIDYDTLGELKIDLLQLVRMLACISLYWMKEVRAIRMNGIRFFFFEDVTEHGPCKTTDVKVKLLFHLMS